MAKLKPIPAPQALLRLVQGNKRFVKNRNTGLLAGHRDSRKLLLKSRGPFAIVLSCSDSRAPSEILFDQGLGDLFIIRVAGNVVAPSLIGSVEFAAATTLARLVVVMGHTECGAIQATFDSIDGKKALPAEHVKDIVERIRPHVQHLAKGKQTPTKRREMLREAVRVNVLASAHHLRHGSRFLEEKVSSGEVLIVGGVYDIETGDVDFFDIPPETEATLFKRATQKTATAKTATTKTATAKKS
ncbi:MAG: carbonic anhydrase [Bdellovibrionota bacterium]